MFSFFRILLNYYRRKKLFGDKVIFNRTVMISESSHFEGMNQIHSHTFFSGDLGYGSYIGESCTIIGKVGRFSSIGSHVRVNYGMHPYTYPYVSTAPCFISPNFTKVQNGSTFTNKVLFKEFRYADTDEKFPIIIGNDVWIGDNVFIVGGVMIGDGAVVLAKACVTKDVPPYAIVGGVPAKVVGYRYSDDDILYLQKISWWNKSIDWLKSNVELFSDFNSFKKNVPL